MFNVYGGNSPLFSGAYPGFSNSPFLQGGQQGLPFTVTLLLNNSSPISPNFSNQFNGLSQALQPSGLINVYNGPANTGGFLGGGNFGLSGGYPNFGGGNFGLGGNPGFGGAQFPQSPTIVPIPVPYPQPYPIQVQPPQVPQQPAPQVPQAPQQPAPQLPQPVPQQPAPQQPQDVFFLQTGGKGGKGGKKGGKGAGNVTYFRNNGAGNAFFQTGGGKGGK